MCLTHPPPNANSAEIPFLAPTHVGLAQEANDPKEPLPIVCLERVGEYV